MAAKTASPLAPKKPPTAKNIADVDAALAKLANIIQGSPAAELVIFIRGDQML